MQQFDYAYQVERSRFDEILLRNARKLGVDVREQHRVIRIETDERHINHVRYVDALGDEHVATSRFVVDASGHQSTFYSLVGERVFSKFFRNVALFCYYENAKRRPKPRDGDILCAAFDAGWFWFIPLSPNLTSVGAVVSPEFARLIRNDHDSTMHGLIARCPTIAELLEPATRVKTGIYGKFRVRSDYSYCNTHFYSDGVILIGDAACFVDPVFSSGVHLATYSALLAARSINSTLGNEVSEDAAFQEFEHRYRIEFQNIYDFLLVIYDMNHDKESYFWNARKIINTDEADNEAFVRLVSGMGTASNDFFRRRNGIGKKVEATLNRHFYDDTSQDAAGAVTTMPPHVSQVELNVSDASRAAVRVGGFQGASVRLPFGRSILRRQGLVESRDGLSWRERRL